MQKWLSEIRLPHRIIIDYELAALTFAITEARNTLENALSMSPEAFALYCVIDTIESFYNQFYIDDDIYYSNEMDLGFGFVLKLSVLKAEKVALGDAIIIAKDVLEDSPNDSAALLAAADELNSAIDRFNAAIIYPF